MQLSTKGRYAVRAMLDLALHAGEVPVSRAEIARRQGISADYIAQLFRKLEQAGLVQGVKGPGGGYVLGRDPTNIHIGDIVRAAEGPIALVDCVEAGGAACARAKQCAARQLWQEVSQVVAQTLDDVTLKDLCGRQAHLAGDGHAAPS